MDSAEWTAYDVEMARNLNWEKAIEKEVFLHDLKQKAKQWFDEYGVAESVTKDGKKYYSRRQVEIAFMQGYETAKKIEG